MNSVLLVAANPGAIRAWLPLCIHMKKHHDIRILPFLGDFFHNDWKQAGFAPLDLSSSNLNDLYQTLANSSALLCGTSVQGSMNFEYEHLLRQKALELSIPCFTLVDHWGNAEHRFSLHKSWDSLGGTVFLPDPEEIKSYPSCDVNFHCFGNPIWECLNTSKPKYRKSKKSVLFISEPIAQDSTSIFKAFTQYDIFAMLCSHEDFSHLDLFVKLHPRENTLIWKQKFPYVRFFDKHPCSSEEQFDAYLGITSMLLIELYIQGHPVASIQPVHKEKMESLPWQLPIFNKIPRLIEINTSPSINFQHIISQTTEVILEQI